MLYESPIPEELTAMEPTEGSCLVQEPEPLRQTVQTHSMQLWEQI